MYDIIKEHQIMIDHIVNNQIKPCFKSCSVHVSNFCGDIHIDVGLISNVLHKNGHTHIQDPLKLTMCIHIYKNAHGLTQYKLSIDTYKYYLKDNEEIRGLCVTLCDGEYHDLLRFMSYWCKTVSIVMYQYRHELNIREDVRYLYV